ncbi:hypothetical protein [Kibdelosporangium phytohabitans]|uniref:hypothetical protein n=1 Tax=Kibdelosporangium phytohabitans TaxID=860235 RepID=UPI0012FB5128|nr:hypothetical protein [Kibdelosporangium phytohabitans]MBE1466220.1 hypothetical protein [Kibdelosporangium phytohabitans]
MVKNIVFGFLFIALLIIAAQAVDMGEYMIATVSAVLALLCGFGIGGRKSSSNAPFTLK